MSFQIQTMLRVFAQSVSKTIDIKWIFYVIYFKHDGQNHSLYT